LTDLQCPAGFVFTVPAMPERARTLAESLRERRVAIVYTGDLPSLTRTAGVIAEELGVPTRDDTGLRESAPPTEVYAATGTVPDVATAADTDTETAMKVRTALSEIADQHRGETVVVVATPRVLALTLPLLAGNPALPWAKGRPLVAGGTVEMRLDDDGWALDAWMGHSDGS
jgi:2,3-bisphosphoglycerate-dependent phosphoglycerate mutase